MEVLSRFASAATPPATSIAFSSPLAINELIHDVFIARQHPVSPAGEQVVYYPGMTDDKRDDQTAPAGLMFSYISDQGLTQADFARRMNESPQTLTNWKRRGIPLARLPRVARAMRMSIDDYLKSSNRPKGGDAAVRQSRGGEAIIAPVLSEVEGSMGGGRVVPAFEVVTGGMSLSRMWIESHLPSVRGLTNLAVIGAIGDSMEPTFADGDIVLVDRGDTEPKSDSIYVFSEGDELFIKRLHRRGAEEIAIRSDNPILATEVRVMLASEIRILGRVVWAWRGKKL